MENISWYILLAIGGLAGASYSIYENKDKHKISSLLVFYLFTAGLTWISEFLVLGLFNSYFYHVGIFESPWAQNLLGHLLLNTTLYPAIAVIMVSYSFGVKWIVFSATLFTSIEYMFVRLDIYKQHWWDYYFTFFTVIAMLIICKKVFTKMIQGCHGKTRAFIYFFVAMVMIHIPAPTLLLLGKQQYKLDIINNYFGDKYLSSIMFSFSYHLIESLLLVIFTCIFQRWYWTLLIFIISIVAQCIFYGLDILIVKENWHFVYTLTIYESLRAFFVCLEKSTLKTEV